MEFPLQFKCDPLSSHAAWVARKGRTVSMHSPFLNHTKTHAFQNRGIPCKGATQTPLLPLQGNVSKYWVTNASSSHLVHNRMWRFTCKMQTRPISRHASRLASKGRAVSVCPYTIPDQLLYWVGFLQGGGAVIPTPLQGTFVPMLRQNPEQFRMATIVTSV